MADEEGRAIEIRSRDLEIGLLSSDDPISMEVDTATSKPPSSSRPRTLYALEETCNLEEKHIARIRNRFQFLEETIIAFLIQMKRFVPLPMVKCTLVRPIFCVVFIFLFIPVSWSYFTI